MSDQDRTAHAELNLIAAGLIPSGTLEPVDDQARQWVAGNGTTPVYQLKENIMQPLTGPAVKPPVKEQSEMLRYAQRTSNAVVFIAWVVGIGLAFSVVTGIFIASSLSQIGTGPEVGNCMSLGGNDPSC